MQQIKSIIMYDEMGKQVGEAPFDDGFELRHLPSECCFIQFTIRDATTGRVAVEIDDTTLYFIGRRTPRTLPKQPTREVLIDGIQYVPIQTVVIDRRVLTRSLVEIGRGSELDKSDDWFDDEAKKLYIEVTDSPRKGLLTVSDFLETLAAR